MDGICVGLGRRGISWVQWARQAGLNVVGAADINEALLHKHGEEAGVPEHQRYTSIAQAAEATSATVATICAANAAHRTCIEQCLEAGLHVIVEKPLVETPADFKQVVAKADEKGLQLAAAQNYRYMPGSQTLRKAVADGLIGQVEQVHVSFSRYRPAPGMKMPLLVNQSIHHFDAMRFILGCDPQWCFAHAWVPQWSRCDDVSQLHATWGFKAEDGRIVPASYTGNYDCQGDQTAYSGRWRIEGSTGTLTFEGDGHASPPVLHRREPASQEILQAVNPRLDNGSAEVCRVFLEALEAGQPAPTRAEDNAHSLSMCWDAVLSSQHNQVVQSGSALAQA